MQTKRISDIVVSKNLPRYNDLWLDTSEGEDKAVLKYKGNPIAGGGSSNTNPGYNITKQTVTLFNDTIETSQVAEGLYQGVVENIDFDLIVGETYTVVFDGTSYDIKAITSPLPGDDNGVILGEFSNEGSSFETYPFVIMWRAEEGEKMMFLGTNTEGSHTVEIKHEEETVTATPEFKQAVDSVTGYSITKSYETYLPEQDIETFSHEGYSSSNDYDIDVCLEEGKKYKVTFNGTEYNVVCKLSDGDYFLGEFIEGSGMQFDNYPFYIGTYEDNQDYYLYLGTQEAGTYSVKIEEIIEGVTTTSEFEGMVRTICGDTGINIIRINNYTGLSQYPNSILIDVNGNEFHEGTDYTINYSDTSTDNPFEKIDTIEFNPNTSAVLHADMIQIQHREQTGYTVHIKTVVKNSFSNYSNLSYWEDLDGSKYVGWFIMN